MFNFLHNFHPDPILISLGSLSVYWYGLFMVISILTALTFSLKLAKKIDFSQNKLFDLGFWVIIFGIVGARIYHIFLEISYYFKNPIDIFKVWQGGLAIHGALIAGIITLYIFCRKEKINFWLLSAIIAPGLALAQAIGRFGNYFNQELFGRPTELPWGIPIDLINRPARYVSAEYFHPTFIYESLGNLIIFAILLFLFSKIAKKKDNKNYEIIAISYAVLYSILRFLLEFVRIDKTLEFFGLRLPQIVSLIIIIACLAFIFIKIKKLSQKNKAV